ncbi:hypothetical protein CEXT_314891 [Caerostris extrusa]|uniref:Uncharacterized protein n=1 Tax=Caerostris extrusa TaxID=172846 RepID=A0AAV4U3I5_CAEEX|nr:hypothetical protein CEXT_314891 [Caerostris extrusa]
MSHGEFSNRRSGLDLRYFDDSPTIHLSVTLSHRFVYGFLIIYGYRDSIGEIEFMMCEHVLSSVSAISDISCTQHQGNAVGDFESGRFYEESADSMATCNSIFQFAYISNRGLTV